MNEYNPVQSTTLDEIITLIDSLDGKKDPEELEYIMYTLIATGEVIMDAINKIKFKLYPNGTPTSKGGGVI